MDSGYSYEIIPGTTDVILTAYGGAETVINKSTVDNGGTTYNITQIANDVFKDKPITSATFGNVITIGSYAFEACRSLISATFPKVITIGNFAFHLCSSLTSATFTVATTIENYAFQSCSLTSAIFPDATTIGSNAFESCSSLTTATFPLATIIKDAAFSNCVLLNSIIFPRIQTIEMNAFMNCRKLKNVHFPSTIISIGIFAFGVLDPLPGEGITDVWFEGSIPIFDELVHMSTTFYPFDKINSSFVLLSRPIAHYIPSITEADKLRLMIVFQTLILIPSPPSFSLAFTNKPHNSMQTGIGSVRNFRAKYRRS